MERYSDVGFIIISILFVFLISCLKTPTDPTTKCENVELLLFTKDNDNTAHAGTAREVGLSITLPHLIDHYDINSSCNDFYTTITITSERKTDTAYIYPVFEQEGICTLRVTGYCIDRKTDEKETDLVIHVLEGHPSLSAASLTEDLTTHAGRSDTLGFIIDTQWIDVISHSVESDPDLGSSEMHLIKPVENDTVLVYFNPAESDTYTVTLTATADTLETTASITVTVFESFIPVSSDNSQTLITGTVDTLMYTLTEAQIGDGITMELLNPEDLPDDIASIIPGGDDSLLIRVSTDREATLSFSIVTTNSELTDTTDYALPFVNATDVVWTETFVSTDATEGSEKNVDLTHHFYTGVTLDAITLNTDAGSIDNSGIWHFTPPWGSESPLSTTITAKRGDTDQNLIILLKVNPEDDTDPVITLKYPSTPAKTISSSKTTVSVIVTDADAGVHTVTFATSETTIEGKRGNDSTFTAVISGLLKDDATEVVITATDKSMNRNSNAKTITLTYDPTMEDEDGPIFIFVNGSQNGERVTMATGTMMYIITDDSDIDSVWWKFNSEFVTSLSVSGDNEYTLNYELTSFGVNRIKLFARDGSSNTNEASLDISLTYNTEPSAITLTSPADNDSNVSIAVTFKWDGGDDADGDRVTFTVNYGTSKDGLTGTATVSGKTATLSNSLDYNTTYFWQVTGSSESSDYSDEVQSGIFKFTTEGSLPRISVHPETVSVEEGESVTFSVTASGFGTLKYQWRENGSDIDTATDNSFTISSVDITLDGNSYDCVVSNDVGDVTSNPATLTVTSIPVYAVTFYPDGGEPAPNVQQVQEGNSVQLPEEMQKDGFRFRGWYTSNSFATEFDFSSPVNGPRYAYARWIAVYAITYQRNEADDGTVPVDENTYENGQMVTAALNSGGLSRNGYTFNGWNTSNTGTGGTHYGVGSTFSMGSDSIVLYAEWKLIPYSITCHYNDGVGSNPISYTIISSNIPLSEASRPAYEFDGWYTDSGFSGSPVTSIPSGSTGDKVFWAKWEMKAPTITDSITDKSCPVNDSVTFTVEATGVDLEYEWQLNDSIVATGSSYTTSSLTADDISSLRLYKCIVSNDGGSVECFATLSVSTVTDIDNNEYHEVKIGNQVWMVENLKVTHFNNGDSIPNLDTNDLWAACTSAAYCWYNNNEFTYKEPYGALYNWHAVVNPDNIAPVGWRVPTDSDWTHLEDFLIANGYNWDSTLVDDKVAKSLAADFRWVSSTIQGTIGSNLESNNRTGFTAFGGGYRAFTNGSFSALNLYGFWWSSTEDDSSDDRAYARSLCASHAWLAKNIAFFNMGYSVRCMRDY